MLFTVEDRAIAYGIKQKTKKNQTCDDTLTDALPLVCNADRSAQEAGGSPQVTRTGIGDAIISAQVLLRGRHLRANPVARHAVGVICLVHDARGAAGAQDVAACFWAETKREGGREGGNVDG